MISHYIDKKIKDLFGLFADPTKKQYDQKLYKQIYGAVHDEMIRFVEDNIEKKDYEELERQIVTIEEKKIDNTDKFAQIYPLFIKSLMNIPDHEYRLHKRLDYYVTNLYFESMKNPRKKKDESDGS